MSPTSSGADATPATAWDDLAGCRVGVWGLGTEGRANLARLAGLGADVVVVDDAPERITDRSGLPGPVLATASGGIDALASCDVVVKTPGISRYRPEVGALAAAGVPVLGGMGLWLAGADRDRVLCITGTKGKSTTTAVAAHLARGLGVDAAAGGNLGLPPWSPDAPADPGLWVVEVSSYQATDVVVGPPVVAVTSLAPDHLPWHGGWERYVADKLSLCTRPGVRVAVVADDGPDGALRAEEARLGPHVRWVRVPEPTNPGGAPDPDDWAAPLGLLGRHNRVDAEVARTALVELGVPGADDDDRLRVAAAGFAGLEHRLQVVAERRGVTFVDDGLSTNVLPTLAAVDAFPGRRVALVAGGLDRGVDVAPLAAGLARRTAPTRVLAVYGTGPAIADAVEAASPGAAGPLDVVRCADLVEAVTAGASWAEPDGVVLLSPAAASFDAFDDHRHRSRAFRDAIAALDA